MPPIRFTVITTSLNNARFIERTLCSVLDQGVTDLQYIVVDRGSDDGTREIIDLYAEDLTSLRMPGASPAEALNAALDRATGDVIAFVEDILLPGALAAVAERMGAGEGADGRGPGWLVTQSQRINDDDMELGLTRPVAPPSLARYLMHDAGLLPLGATFIRRALLERAGGFDENMQHAHDYDCWCRLLGQGVHPTIGNFAATAVRERDDTLTAAQALAQGLEFINVARRYARHLPLREQAALWRNCDQRQRIYALAEAELFAADARRHLWSQLASHPWWIMDQSVRHTLMHGVAHPAPAALARPAA